MKDNRVIVLDYLQVPLTIIYIGMNGVKREYKVKPSADKCGILLNKD